MYLLRSKENGVMGWSGEEVVREAELRPEEEGGEGSGGL
jgi:hypothetical protein